MTLVTPSVRVLLLAVLALLLPVLGGCGGGGGGEAGPAGADARRTSFDLASTEVGVTFTIRVFLPAGYDAGTTRHTVIYAMDAESRFTLLADILERERRPIILVAIPATSAARRFVDFSWPGADAYYRFLTRELIPRVDATYRTDTASRALTGHSLSAQMVMYALYLERAESRFFNAFIPEDGSFWYGPDQRLVGPLDEAAANRLEAEMRARTQDLPVSLAMSGDRSANYLRVQQVHDYLAGRGYGRLRLQLRDYSFGHVAMDGPAFIDSIAFIYGP